MPETVVPPLTEQEIAARRDATRNAIASARIEGLAVSATARSLMDLPDAGQIGGAELIAVVRRLYAGC